ncbi:CBS domain-containing protein CBSX3 [Phytophthora citrophthora]|uniref:CBS domain-containing protein CBSX3 n=1 Tax=Phytophthora citrophthora TaxID=4793 RepID=A0AAD9LS22_9STRA|nr:CBS domain-containing protein CBSX3 [Phytophthora citrophthora]
MNLLSAPRLLGKRSGALVASSSWRSVYTKGLAKDLMNKSCYSGVNFVIPEEATVFEALTRMAGINLGCLAVSGDDGKFVGVVTERDYLRKVELQGLTAKDTLVGQIMTHRARLIVAGEKETPSQLMTKMLSSDVRHLPVINEDGDLTGMLSIKDLVREINREHDADMDTLSNFAMGHGGHFVLD